MDRLNDIKLEFKQRPYLRNHQVEWLIEKVEEQQKEIERLQKILIDASKYIR
jgi:hypothetical protein